MTRNKEATVGAETYGATSLKFFAGNSSHSLYGLYDLFGRRDIPLLKDSHRLRIDGLNERRLLGSPDFVRRSRLQSARFVSRCGLDDSNCFCSRRDRCNEAAVAIKANHSGARESVSTRF